MKEHFEALTEYRKTIEQGQTNLMFKQISPFEALSLVRSKECGTPTYQIIKYISMHPEQWVWSCHEQGQDCEHMLESLAQCINEYELIDQYTAEAQTHVTLLILYILEHEEKDFHENGWENPKEHIYYHAYKAYHNGKEPEVRNPDEE